MKGWLRIVVAIAALAVSGVVLKYIVFKPDVVPVTVFRVARGIVERP